MMNNPPPGYNVNAVNDQQPQIFNQPGFQGATAQGYGDQYKSSFAWPSSYSTPSSVNAPNPYYEQTAPQPENMQAMVKALRGA